LPRFTPAAAATFLYASIAFIIAAFSLFAFRWLILPGLHADAGHAISLAIADSLPYYAMSRHTRSILYSFHLPALFFTFRFD